MDWSPVVDWLNEHGWRILLIIVIAVVIYFALRHFIPPFVRRAVRGTMKKKPKSTIDKRTKTLSSVFIDTGLVLIIIVTIFTILSELKINIAPALAGLGIAGLAVGFGAQSLVKDFFNGVLILMENQYSVGDVVTLAGVTGTVEQVNLRRTVLRDLDGVVHTIPNGEVNVASNYTKEWSRVNLNISVGYGENLYNVIQVINRVGKEMAEDPAWASKILTPPQVLRIDSLGDSGIDVKILGETKSMEQWAIMGELRLRLKKVFDEEGIEIPWPHTKVYFGNMPVQEGVGDRLLLKQVEESGVRESQKSRRRRKIVPPEGDEAE
jgi:small conductance mechanosensitive channel